MSDRISYEERKDLSDSAYGLPERREYPMPDAAHVRAAEAYFRYCPDDLKPRLARACGWSSPRPLYDPDKAPSALHIIYTVFHFPHGHIQQDRLKPQNWHFNNYYAFLLGINLFFQYFCRN